VVEIVAIAAASVIGMTAVCCGAFYLVWRIVESKDRQLDAFADRVQAPAAATVAAFRRQAPPERPEPEPDEFPELPPTDPDLEIQSLLEE